LIYSYTNLRDIVRDHEATLNPNADKENVVAFDSPELVITQSSGKTPSLKGANLKYPVDSNDILKFIRLNRNYLTDKSGTLEFNPKGDSPSSTERRLQITKRLEQVDEDEFDAEIVEFDDEFVDVGMFGLQSELVFAIIVNRTQKRVTVIFRGSASLKDWLIDGSLRKRSSLTLQDLSKDKIRVHRGFAKYLFGETLDDESESKYFQITDLLKQLYAMEQYKDYDLYITGHSLGGALTQLLAFTLAGRLEMDGLPTNIRVNAISYASPRVGNKAYQDAFTALENNGKLRHVRVSNEGDVVAVAPSIGFWQTGLNLHVNPDGMMDVNYLNNRTFFSQVNLGAAWKHGLDSYH